MKYLIPFLLLGSGCSMYVKPTDIHTIWYDEQNEWLKEPMYLAIEFWDGHGAIFADDKNSPDLFIDVKDLPPDRISQCDCHFDTSYVGHGTIDIIPSRFDNGDLENSCVLAHEMGHSLGMNHVSKINSLMYFVDAGPDPTTHQCRWTDADQKEFDRATYK